jgi:hypothetical protein
MREILFISAAIPGATGGVVVGENGPNPSQGQYFMPLLGGPGRATHLYHHPTKRIERIGSLGRSVRHGRTDWV